MFLTGHSLKHEMRVSGTLCRYVPGLPVYKPTMLEVFWLIFVSEGESAVKDRTQRV